MEELTSEFFIVIGFSAYLICAMIYAIINMTERYIADETRYKSMYMLEKYLKYGSVVLMTDTKEAMEETNNAVFVKNERWFWRVLNDFNGVASRWFDDKTVKANINVEVDFSGRKHFKYYFEGFVNTDNTETCVYDGVK